MTPQVLAYLDGAWHGPQITQVPSVEEKAEELAVVLDWKGPMSQPLLAGLWTGGNH